MKCFFKQMEIIENLMILSVYLYNKIVPEIVTDAI